MPVAMFVGYRAHGFVGALVAGVAMFLPTSLLAAVVARRWERLRGRPWALAAERALAPVGIGLMAAGVYTLARAAVHDWVTTALATAAPVVLAARWLPPGVRWLPGGPAGRHRASRTPRACARSPRARRGSRSASPARRSPARRARCSSPRRPAAG